MDACLCPHINGRRDSQGFRPFVGHRISIPSSSTSCIITHLWRAGSAAAQQSPVDHQQRSRTRRWTVMRTTTTTPKPPPTQELELTSMWRRLFLPITSSNVISGTVDAALVEEDAVPSFAVAPTSGTWCCSGESRPKIKIKQVRHSTRLFIEFFAMMQLAKLWTIWIYF